MQVSGTQTCAKQEKYSTLAFHNNRKDGEKEGRVLKGMSSLRKFNIEVQM